MKKLIFIILFALPLVACGKSERLIPPPYKFSDDAWDTVSEVAKGGLENLIETYHPAGDTFIYRKEDTDDEKTAKTRQVHIDGIGMFKVRVIGENHDVDKNGKKVPLTFEFVSMLHSVPYSLEAEDGNPWQTSHLREFLNTFVFNLFSNELQYSIKTVKKKVLNKRTGKVTTCEEKVFPLSYTEIGGKVEDESHVDEGVIYRYYEIYNTQEDRKKDPDAEQRGNKCRYWLRSPCVDSDVNGYYVHEDGRFSLDDICIQLGVAPVFAV